MDDRMKHKGLWADFCLRVHVSNIFFCQQEGFKIDSNLIWVFFCEMAHT